MIEGPKQHLEICKRCDWFFHEQLQNAIKSQHAQISDEASFYLLTLLIQAIINKTGVKADTLAEVSIQARMVDKLNSAILFQYAGDFSLMVTGVWWQDLTRRFIDPDYYIQVGKFSYRKAAERTPLKTIKHILIELSDKFVVSADVLMEATRCISNFPVIEQDILKIYERWLKTRSFFLEQKLRTLNINPVYIAPRTH